MADKADGEAVQSKRMFINCVDLYQGSNFAKYLSNCVVGASLEEVEEEEEDGRSVSSLPIQKEGCYEIIATLKNKDAKKPDFVKEIIQYETKEQLYEHLYECEIIVYDITDDADQIDEATWAVSELHSDLEKMESSKVFILVSSVLTWARSKPLDPDDPDIPFTEEDYRRRKPHPNYKDHISAEKTVIKLGKTNKNKLTTYVVSSGLTYGCGENIFHFLFKAAWHNAPQLQCFGNGQNVVPSIHVKDLAAVIQNIADSRPKTRYLVAVDDSQNTLEEIVKAVSQNLGTGQIKMMSKEEALLLKDVKQTDFDQLLVNLRMDAVFVKENMHISWVAEAGLVENIQQIVREYRTSRSLLPIRACILGPPGVGKTTVVKQLCEFYKLHHVKIEDVITESIANLEKSAARVDAEEEEDDDGKAAEDQELLESVLQSKEENDGRIEDQYIVRFFREKLKSMPCQNQGFILDGYPKLLDQAKELFQSEEDDEEESRMGSYDKAIMPENIVVLNADDEFLKKRIMDLPESEVTGTHNTETGLMRRLEAYRSANTEDETVLNYFDELEFHPEHFDITKDKSPMMADTVEKIKKIMGKARNYGPTEEELEEMRRVEEDERRQRESMEAAMKAQQEADEAEERQRREKEWADRLAIVKKEEFELLETQSIPLRNYLMKHVMPTLTQGLVDCCKVRPDDAVDYLPLKVFLHGPPASGKSVLAERLCRHYNLHHIQLAPLLEEAIARLERNFPADGEDEASDDEENEDKQLVRRIQNVREEARDRGEDFSLEHVLDDHVVARFVEEKLKSMPCQNQGFVLEGYPRTYEQAKDLFGTDDAEESTAEESRQISTDPVIAPSHVFVLHGQDDFLRERVLNMPERQMMLSYKTDAIFARQLADYRDTNHEDESKTVVSVFAEDDVVIENLDIPTDLDGDKGTLFQTVIDRIGDQRTMEVSSHQKNEDLVQEMAQEMKRLQQEEAAQQAALQQADEQKSLLEKQQFMAYEKSVQEEVEHLTELSVPLRNFLMMYVLPTLIKGLTKTCDERPSPDKCIDFLAEYLFKNNPQIGYTFSGPVPWREDQYRDATAEPELEPVAETTESTLSNVEPEPTPELY